MKNLQNFRQEIDRIDLEICKLIAKRFAVTQKVGLYKIKNNLPLEDKKREAAIMQKLIKKSKALKLDPILIQQIFRLIIEKIKKNYKRL